MLVNHRSVVLVSVLMLTTVLINHSMYGYDDWCSQMGVTIKDYNVFNFRNYAIVAIDYGLTLDYWSIYDGHPGQPKKITLMDGSVDIDQYWNTLFSSVKYSITFWSPPCPDPTAGDVSYCNIHRPLLDSLVVIGGKAKFNDSLRTTFMSFHYKLLDGNSSGVSGPTNPDIEQVTSEQSMPFYWYSFGSEKMLAEVGSLNSAIFPVLPDGYEYRSAAWLTLTGSGANSTQRGLQCVLLLETKNPKQFQLMYRYHVMDRSLDPPYWTKWQQSTANVGEPLTVLFALNNTIYALGPTTMLKSTNVYAAIDGDPNKFKLIYNDFINFIGQCRATPSTETPLDTTTTTTKSANDSGQTSPTMTITTTTTTKDSDDSLNQLFVVIVVSVIVLVIICCLVLFGILGYMKIQKNKRKHDFSGKTQKLVSTSKYGSNKRQKQNKKQLQRTLSSGMEKTARSDDQPND
ncbi:uncharacterized protein LOC128953964 [Oppia nitens]|uniref:uncharacterized protein LOC128953964 n=1 Tax=Oppia nitens TaxID=1686743 RepID=UPI0023DABE98|nr:uncharacterized protein LOC128953964 [Oppia nitens]